MAKRTATKRLPVSAKGNGRVDNSELVATMNRISKSIQNIAFSRARLSRAIGDPRRDIDDECGYPKIILLEDYKEMYDRLGVATRVVEVLPRESWQVPPTVFEDADPEVSTPFEEAFEELGDLLRGESWYMDDQENGSPIWEFLLRADELSGIGTFGVLLLGFDDATEGEVESLRRPVTGIKELGTAPVEFDAKTKRPRFPEGKATTNYQLTTNAQAGSRKLLYLRAFDESQVQISQKETNRNSFRFNQPVRYRIQLEDPAIDNRSGVGSPLTTLEVHWTRIIHVADNLGSSDFFGAPRQKPVYNHLMALRQLYGSSSEMYYKGAFPGIAAETHPQLGPDVEIDAADMREQMEKWMNGLQRFLAAPGIHWNSLSPQVVDPTPQINVQLEAICIRLGIPKRIFVGSERGELASSQDLKTWHARLAARQLKYITPRIIAPFIDRLILVGVLPQPESGAYFVEWADLNTLTDLEQAEVGLKRTEALTKYIGGNGEAVVPVASYLIDFLGLPEEKVIAFLEAAVEAIEGEDRITPDPIVEEEKGREARREEFTAKADEKVKIEEGKAATKNISVTEIILTSEEEKGKRKKRRRRIRRRRRFRPGSFGVPVGPESADPDLLGD